LAKWGNPQKWEGRPTSFLRGGGCRRKGFRFFLLFPALSPCKIFSAPSLSIFLPLPISL
jgi:hypothetical protein